MQTKRTVVDAVVATESHVRRPYERPTLITLGRVADLTQGGSSGGGDGLSGRTPKPKVAIPFFGNVFGGNSSD